MTSQSFKTLCSTAARISVVLVAIAILAAAIGCDEAQSKSLAVASGHALNLADPDLVAYWDFNEGTGTALIDRSGKGNNGTVQNGTWDPNGREGGCVYFNGTNSVVSIPDNPGNPANNWNQGTPKTYNLWYKMDGGDPKYILDHRYTGAIPGSFAFNGPTSMLFTSRDSLGIARQLKAPSPSGYGQPVVWRTWTMATVVITDTEYRLYRDGQFIATTAIPGSPPLTGGLPLLTGPLYFGARGSVGTEYFRGWIDTAAFYKRALTDVEIAALYLENAQSSDLVGEWSFDEMQGTTAFDSSGRGNNGLIQNATWDANGRWGGSLYFNGSSSVVEVPQGSWNQGTPMTCIAWYRMDGATGGYVFEHEFGGAAAGGFALDRAESMSFRAYDSASTQRGVADPAGVSAGVWTMAAAVVADGQLRLYRDGQLVGTTATTGAVPVISGPLFFGARGSEADGHFSGWIDEVKVYKRALTQDELQTIYQRYQGSDLVAHWSFDETSGTTAADHSGRGNHGTAQNVTWDPNGRVGGAAYLNGTNSLVTIQEGSWNHGTPMTYNLWYKMDGATFGWVTEHILTGSIPGSFAMNAPWAMRFSAYDGGGTARYIGTPSNVPSGIWMMATLVVTPTELRLYRDGALVSTTPIQGGLQRTPGKLFFGARGSTSSNYFRGWIDDTKIWRRALSAVEIQALYADYSVCYNHSCGNGEGPCTSNYGCEAGLVCGYGIGPRFGLPPDIGVCWDPRICATLESGECGDPDDICGDDCCVPNCGAAGSDDGCEHECASCVPGADTDGDTIPDCDEQNDSDDWTNPQVFNGVAASQGNSCHVTPICGLINTRAKIDACFVSQESQLLASGWDFSTTDQDLCDAGFDFEPQWEECREDFAVRYQASVRLAGMGRHCFQLEGPTTSQCASMFIGATAITTGAPVCMNLTGGTYGIEWFYETTSNGTNALHIEHCFGGASDCVPTDPIDPADLLPPGPLPSCAPDCSATACGNGVLDLGEACDTGLTPHCLPDCSATSSATVCNSDSDCPTAQVCGLGNGPQLNQNPLLSYCWPRVPCGENPAESCGSPDSACGACMCVPNCASKTCGDDPDNGCNGFCTGLCSAGEAGCRLNTDCPYGYVCGIDDGPRYGFAAGTNVCIRSDVDYIVASTVGCGSFSDIGGLCLINPNPPPADSQCTPGCGADQHCGADGACRLKDATIEPVDLANAAPDTPTAEVGTLPGSFTVGDNGAAQYRIPIEVPPGRAGMQPELALQYDSASGNSMVGRGWSLVGLPAVTRCARTAATDGVAVGVLASAEDAYCLGADRLIPVNGGAPGAEGTEYRTEIDSFTKVISFGPGVAPDGSYTGPTHFRAWTKSGRILSFGQNPDGRRTSDGVNLIWYVTNIEDHHGNGMTVTYDRWTGGYPLSAFVESSGTDQVNPTAIYYTQGHGSAGSRKVVFVYGQPTGGDILMPRKFIAGAPVRTTSALARIETYVESELVRTYKLANRVVDTDVLLDSLEACVPSSGGERCMTPTVFTYNESPILMADAAGVEPVGHLLAGIGAGAGWQPGANPIAGADPQRVLGGQTVVLDVDGNGTQDLMQGTPTNEGGIKHRWTIRAAHPLNNGTFFSLPSKIDVIARGAGGLVTDLTEEFQRCHSFTVLDFNEDGRDDLFGQCPLPSSSEPSRGPRYIFTNESEGTVFTRILVDDPTFASNHPPMSTMLHDLDGDGRLDYVLVHGTGTCTGDAFGSLICPPNPYHILWRKNRGPAFLGDQLAPLVEVFVTERYAEGDYDGNGSPDLLVRAADGRSAILKLDAAGVPRLSFGPKLAQLPPQPDPASANLWQVLPSAYAPVGPVRLDANGDGVQDSFGWQTGRWDFEPVTQKLHFGLNTASSVNRSEFATSLGDYYIVGGGRTELGAPEYKAYSAPVMFVMDRDSDGRDEIYVAPGPLTASYWRKHEPLGPGNLWTTSVSDIPWLQRVEDTRMVTDGFGNVLLDETRQVAAWQNWQRPVVMDFDGDGTADLVARNGDKQDPYMEVRRTLSRTRHRMIGVRNGLGENVEVEYDFAPDGSLVYTNAHGACAYPQRCLKTAPYPLVSAHTVSGSGGPFLNPASPQPSTLRRRFEYKYQDGRSDALGRGFLGFASREVHDLVPAADGSPSWTALGSTRYQADLTSYDETLKMYWRAGRPAITTRTRTAQGNELTGGLPTEHVDVVMQQWGLHTALSGRRFVALDSSLSASVENGVLVKSKTESVDLYDGYGNPRQVSTNWDVGDDHTIGIGIEYDLRPSFVADWQVALPRLVTIAGATTSDPDPSTVKYVRIETTYNERGLPEVVTRGGAVGVASFAVDRIATSTFDVFSNVTEVIQSGIAGTAGGDPPPDRAMRVTYDAEGYFTTLVENGVHRTLEMPGTAVNHDPRNGRVRYQRTPSGDWSGSLYDGLNRLVWHRDTAGRISTITYAPGSQAGGPIETHVEGVSIPEQVTEYNAFGRPILERITRLAGRESRREIAYNDRGQVVAQGVPHLSGVVSPGATFNSYDELGRLISTEYPWQHADGTPAVGTIQHAYASVAHATTNAEVDGWLGLTNAQQLVLTEDAAGHRSFEAMDMRGNTTTVVDAHGQPAIYSYGAFDHLASVYFAGAGSSIQTDQYGQVTRYADLERGIHEYHYNGFGDVASFVRNPELPSEQASSFAYDGLGRMVASVTPDGTYAWEWDGDGSDVSDIGQLVVEELTSNTIGGSRSEYEYAGPGGAVSEVRKRIRNDWFTTAIDYDDELALPETVSYPTPDGLSFGIRYAYDASGYGQITGLRDVSDNTQLWSLVDIDAFGAVRESTTGNAVTLRQTREARTGLTSRIEAFTSSTSLSDESFAYDQRGLLAVRETQDSGSTLTQEYGHDELGRLTDHVVQPGSLFQYDYDARGNVRENPVAGALNYDIASRPHSVSSTADGRSFFYDDHGNQFLRNGPDGRQELDYTAFDLPSELREGPDNAPSRVTRYEYDGTGGRVVRESDDGSSTTYVDGLYREDVQPGGAAVDRVAMVGLPDGRVLHIDLDQSAPASRYQYEQHDHLGSVVALINGVGARTDERTYSPFGRSTTQSGPIRAGFTGHEHDREQSLINMRGRMYDPAIGRFLTPDPLLTASLGTQGLNPYSYVLNSPLNWNDPTGFSPCGKGVDPAGCEPPIAPFTDDKGVIHLPPVVITRGESAEQVAQRHTLQMDLAGTGLSSGVGALEAENPYKVENMIPMLSPVRDAQAHAELALDAWFARQPNKFDVHYLWAWANTLFAVLDVLSYGSAEVVRVPLYAEGRTLLRAEVRAVAPRGAGKLLRFDGPKPGYSVNPAHVPGRGLRPGKTPLPNDAAEVFKNAVPNDATNPTAWFGRSADGQIYRYSSTNDGTAHFSGIHGVGDGTRNITQYAMDRLEGL